MKILRTTALLSLLAFGSCAPTETLDGQVVLWIDTDALLPATAGSTLEGPIFDSLRVEVFEPGKSTPCEGCARTFSIDAARLARAGLSFGMRAPRDGYRVRLRMYPSFATLTGDPPEYDDGPAMSVIEAVVRLDSVPRGFVVERNVFLATEDVGAPRGTLDEPIVSSQGRVRESKVGTWPGATAVPCTAEPRDYEVCVEGGAFWMGNSRAVDTGFGDGGDRLRLVVLSPFIIDSGEVTVKNYRVFGGMDATPWSGNSAGDSDLDFCTFSQTTHDDLPVNCITFDGARRYCRAHGGDFPSEAQFEFVAGARQGRLWVWGQTEPGCDDAILMRGGWGIYNFAAADCKPETPPGSPLAIVGRPKPGIDRWDSPNGSGTVWDLVGNLTEYMADSWNRQVEPCWSAPGIFVDPKCSTPSAIDPKRPLAIKGASYVDSARIGAAAMRGGVIDTFSTRIGFRCARSGFR